MDGRPVALEQAYTIEIDQFGPAEVEKAIADLERFTALLREYPEEATSVLNDVIAGRQEVANRGARRIGLTEEAFRESGGGFVWAVAIIFAGAAILTAAAFSHPQSPHPPHTEPPDAGPPVPEGEHPPPH
jgi:hypothetical protein